MRNLALLVAIALVLFTDARASWHGAAAREGLSVRKWGSRHARNIVNAALKLGGERRILEAGKLYNEGYQDALRRGHPLAAFWFLTGSGGSHFALLEYRQALDDYLAARDTALKAGLRPEAAVAFSNLSSLYLHVSDTGSALSAAEEAYHLLPENQNSPERSLVVVQLARVLLIRGDGQRAQPLFEEAIRIASKAKDRRTEALAWDQMGLELMRAGNLKSAEQALNNALSLRRSLGDPNMFATQYKLGMLDLKKGDATAARHLIDAAFRTPNRDPLQIPTHHFYWAYAEILRALGDRQGALVQDLLATDAADEWRTHGLFADEFRISTDSLLHEIYDGAVDTAVDLYRESGNPRYAILSWQLNERIRAASLRESLKQGHNWTAGVPAEYWPMLDRLRALDGDRLATAPVSGAVDSDETVRLRMHLAEMEARASATESRNSAVPPTAAGDSRSTCKKCGNASENFLPGLSLIHIQEVLGNSRTLISFHVGEKFLYRWVITGRKFDLKVLPGGHTEQIASLRAALRDNAAGAPASLAKGYLDLFGDIPHTGDGRWSVALDGDLFELPLAGLVCVTKDGHSEYLVERRALELVPGAWAIGSHSGASKDGAFVGIGDGVYNVADSRYGANAQESTWKRPLPALFAAHSDPMQLPRLAASGREIVECARHAGGSATLLMGRDASRKNFVAALAERPAIIHIAAHFLTERDGEKSTAIAFGLRPDPAGNPRWEFLTSDDIRSLQVPGSIVVMSGCSSSAGRVAPAAGLLGLAHAWLDAGAAAVIATQWPVPDDSGELFLRFYDHLRGSLHGDRLAPAEALRRAQVDMLHSSTARAEPRYWAAYQIFARSN